jgi:hypothetical protein
MQALRGTPETAFLGNGDELSELAQIHDFILATVIRTNYHQ